MASLLRPPLRSTSLAPSAAIGGQINPRQHSATGRRRETVGSASSRSRLDRGAAPVGAGVVSSSSSSSSSPSPSDPPCSPPPADRTKNPVSIRLPIGAGDQADQAAAACVAAWRRDQGQREGRGPSPSTRLLVTLSLPLVGATDLDDWPGGIRQQFKAAKPMVERMLSEIRKQAAGASGEPFRESPRPSLWDDADAVVCYDSPRLACVVFPTPETLKRLDDLATTKEERGPGSMTIVVNPQWSLERGSQLISDFGIGPWRAANERKASSFGRAYCLKSVRIRGDEARVWYSAAAAEGFARVAPSGEGSTSAGAGQVGPVEPTGPWNVFLVTSAGSMSSSSRLIWSGTEEPSYSQLELLLKKKGNVASKGWLERAQSEAKFLKDSL